MNVTESSHVNTLLNWLLQLPRSDGHSRVTDEEAKQAAAALGDAAYKRLMAGVNGAKVRKHFRVQAELWPALTEPTKTQLDLLGAHKRPTPPQKRAAQHLKEGADV